MMQKKKHLLLLNRIIRAETKKDIIPTPSKLTEDDVNKYFKMLFIKKDGYYTPIKNKLELKIDEELFKGLIKKPKMKAMKKNKDEVGKKKEIENEMNEPPNEYTADELELIQKVSKKAEERKINKQNFIKSLNIMSIGEYKNMYRDNFEEFYKNINSLYEFLNKDENNFNLLSEEQRNIIAYLFDYYEKMFDRGSFLSTDKRFFSLNKYIDNNKLFNKFKNEYKMKNIFYLYDFNADETKKYKIYENFFSFDPKYIYEQYKELPNKLQILEKEKFFIVMNDRIKFFIEDLQFNINDRHEYLMKEIDKNIIFREDSIKRVQKKNDLIELRLELNKYKKADELIKKNVIISNDIFKKMENIGDIYNLKDDYFSYSKINDFIYLYNKLPFKNMTDYTKFYFDTLIKLRNKSIDELLKIEKKMENEFNIKSHINVMYPIKDILDNKKDKVEIIKIDDNNKREILFNGIINFTEMRIKLIEFIKLYKNEKLIIRKSNGAILFQY